MLTFARLLAQLHLALFISRAANAAPLALTQGNLELFQRSCMEESSCARSISTGLYGPLLVRKSFNPFSGLKYARQFSDGSGSDGGDSEGGFSDSGDNGDGASDFGGADNDDDFGGDGGSDIDDNDSGSVGDVDDDSFSDSASAGDQDTGLATTDQDGTSDAGDDDVDNDGGDVDSDSGDVDDTASDAGGSDVDSNADDDTASDAGSTTSDASSADLTSSAAPTSTADASTASDSADPDSTDSTSAAATTTAASSTDTENTSTATSAAAAAATSSSSGLSCTGGSSPNAATISLIQHFEGFVAQPAPDPIGLQTVGFGHKCTSTGCAEVTAAGFSFPLTQDTAAQLLNNDVQQFVSCVNSAVSNNVVLTDNQVGALTSFTFNLGCATLQSSTLLQQLNSGQDPNTVASQQIPRFNHAGGKVLAGLTSRRAAEVALFQTPSQVQAHPC